MLQAADQQLAFAAPHDRTGVAQTLHMCLTVVLGMTLVLELFTTISDRAMPHTVLSKQHVVDGVCECRMVSGDFFFYWCFFALLVLCKHVFLMIIFFCKSFQTNFADKV